MIEMKGDEMEDENRYDSETTLDFLFDTWRILAMVRTEWPYSSKNS